MAISERRLQMAKMSYQAATRGWQVGCLLLVTIALVSVKWCDAQDTNERYHVCNGARMPDWEYQQATLNAINEVVARTSGPGYAYKAQYSVSGKVGYAGGACNGQIDKAACDRCMAVAYSILRQWCVDSSTGAYAVGARIELNDCRLRWELYSFEPMQMPADM